MGVVLGSTAYTPFCGVVTDAAARLAVVRTPQGLYLPGGGIEAGETPRETVVKRSTFLDARFSGTRVATTDPDHELEWLLPKEAASGLAHPSHRWAVEQWLDRDSPG